MSDGNQKVHEVPLEEITQLGPMCECGHRRSMHYGAKWACDFYVERENVCDCIKFRRAS